MNFGYLKNINIIRTLWTINPKPIVATLSMSLTITALANNSVNAPQVSRTKSTLGSLSVKLILTANKLGMVAACNIMLANQAIVSELITPILLLITNLVCSIHLLTLDISIPIKNMITDYTNPFFAPIWANINGMKVHGIFH